MAAFYDAPSDLWIPGYDQFGISCWQNKVTRELRYSDTPPRQPPALHPPAYVGDSYYPHLSTGRPFQHAARPPADRVPAWELGKNVQFQSPALNVPGPAAAKDWAAPPAATGWTAPPAAKGWTAPAVGEPRPPPPSFVIPRGVSPPRPSPRAPRPQKKSKNEADQWSLQRNGKGEEYYLNTSSWKWQTETPDCLKKYTTRR